MESSKLYLIQHEKMFIRGLGTGAFVPTQELSRKELLQEYIKTTAIRKNWNGVDRYGAAAFARECLEVEFYRESTACTFKNS
jgi:hypothetical protein|tara:strand:+ start:2674 stop:2919 length:246 start_codon:yes stop_codon:yes gene_type:complete